MKKLKTIAPVFLLLTCSLSAQYFGETVQEKQFEVSDLFFSSNAVNPYGIGDFGAGLPGVIDNPLLNLSINPAFLSCDSLNGSWLYINFRNSREIQDKPGWRGLHDGGRDYLLPYPGWYAYGRSRQVLEPVVTAAWLYRPGETGKGPLTIGLTYQGLLQDEAYYDIPYDVYRSSPGYDFAGIKTSEVADYSISDRYRGEDGMHSDGHLITGLLGLRFSPRLYAGIQVNRTLFNREGSLANQTQWDQGMFDETQNRYSTMQSRDQDYAHWDVSAGILANISSQTLIGLSGGLLQGRALQHLDRSSTYLYRRGTIGEGTSWSCHEQEGFSRQSWRHEGNTYYAGLNLKTVLKKGRTLHLYYKYSREDVDIGLSGTTRDTSFSNYYSLSDSWESRSESVSSLYDDRTGSGTRESNAHTLGAGLQWRLGGKTQLGLGLRLLISSRTTGTSEQVLADRMSAYDSFWAGVDYEHSYSHFYSLDEKKTLDWDLTSRVTGFQIPVHLKHRVSKHIALQFGIMRHIHRYTITDETLALFDWREVQDGEQTEKRTMFGERYVEPDEIHTDVSTTVLAGLNIVPADGLDIEFLIVPSWIKTWAGTTLGRFQWWINCSFSM